MNNAATVDLTALSDDLREAAKAADVEVMDILVNMAEEIAEVMRQEAPVQTGKLRDSIRVKVMSDHIVIGPEGVDYAVYVHYGTKPHEIRAKNASALKFRVNGNTVFATVVQHPGTDPNPFAARAAQQFLDSLGSEVADKGVELIVEGKR